jgi:Na+/H+-dicarboxylate symporter
MTERVEAAAGRPIRGGRSLWMLGALILGLVLGALVGMLGDGPRQPALHTATMVGGLWLNALKMTVIPLIIALLVIGIAQGAEAMRAGRIAARTMAWFVGVYVGSAILGAAMIAFLLRIFPLPREAIEALRAGMFALDPKAASPAIPPVSEFFSSVVPSNVIAAAAETNVLQLVVFTSMFAFAAARIPVQGRQHLLGFFEAVRDALLVMIGWVLWIAPIGVFALAFALASGAGAAAVAALLHYTVLVSLIGVGVGLAGYAVAVLGGRRSLGSFTRAMFAPRSFAVSTRSSLASIPVMLLAARSLGVREKVADVTFPLIGALFRPTGPAMNIAVAFYVAHWFGLQPTLMHVVAAVAVASMISFGSISVPGEVSFLSSMTPIALALGVPIAPLALLVAIEMVPDIFRTLGNVTMDVAVTTAVDRGAEAETPAKQA